MFLRASILLLCWGWAESLNTTTSTPSLGEMPHAVVVLILENGKTVGKCTGSIIHEAWVLTAGHCVVKNNGKQYAPGEILVVAGVIDYENKGPSAQERNGLQIVVHKDYVESRLAKFDLALIKVLPFNVNNMVKPVKLSAKEWPQDGRMYNRKCTSAGWGMLEGRTKTSVLHKQATTAKHGLKACHCVPDGYALKRIICLTPEDKIGVCFGDSGGALLCDGEAVGVSHVIMDKRSCSYFKSPDDTIMCESPAVFGVYMYICPFLPWIREHVPDMPTPPASCPAPPSAPLSHTVIALVMMASLAIFKLIRPF
ncbi:serine protease 38 [Nilaparvata lugens]|uniref:trypsin n=1 Tax=Nilaparvata lugens TaxID=108931 RepID=A0A068F781_NILLU|nr:serine protease 38 [Nilaparvata lugens]AID60315.1 serine protease SP24D [Nilaparvata lugens]